MRKTVTKLIREVTNNMDIDDSNYERVRNTKIVHELVPKIHCPKQFTTVPTYGEGSEALLEPIYKFQRVINKHTGLWETQKVQIGTRRINPKKRVERQARKAWNSLPRTQREMAHTTLLTAIVHGVSFDAAV